MYQASVEGWLLDLRMSQDAHLRLGKLHVPCIMQHLQQSGRHRVVRGTDVTAENA